VTEKTFPAPENWFGMADEEYEQLERGGHIGTEPAPDAF
jgi:hypothetical protein